MRISFSRTVGCCALAGAVGCASVSKQPEAIEPTAALSMRPFPGAGAARAVPGPFAFQSLEGPFWVARGGYLLFSDVVEENGPAAHIYRYSPGPGGSAGSFAIEPYPVGSTSTNGLAVDHDGNLVACERWNGSVARIAGARRFVLADRYPTPGGAALNAPNDLVVRADGNIYFTDTKWGARPGPHAPLAVYRIGPDGALSVAFAISMPNGIALSPDERTLYVGSDEQNRIWRLPLDARGAVEGTASVLIDATRVPGGAFKVPDGICIDDTGNLYVPNNSDEVKAIEVFGADGAFKGAIPIAARPSNCTFG